MSISWSTIRDTMGLTGQFSISTFRALSPNNANGSISASHFNTGDSYKGLISSYPATNAYDIKVNTGVNTDGVYHINCNGTSTRTYCIMDSRYDGGGWMLIMKATTDSVMGWNATYWTSTALRNETDLTRNDANAKYNAFNYVPIKDVMALWPTSNFGYSGGCIPAITDSWVWLVNNWYNSGTRITALTGFQTPRNAIPSRVYDFAGYKSAVFSTQSVENRHIFGDHTFITGGSRNWGTARWGFVFNENGVGDFGSCDVWSGIGVSTATNGWSATLPDRGAGDSIGCCQNFTGSKANQNLQVQLYGR